MSRKPKLEWRIDTDSNAARHIAALNTVIDVIDRGDGWGVELFVLGQFRGRRKLACRRGTRVPLLAAERRLPELIASAGLTLLHHCIKLKELRDVLRAGATESTA